MPPYPLGSFHTFVGLHLPRLAQLADLLTGDRAEADQVVVEAFLEMYGVWPSVAASRDPLATARRRLVATHRRTSRRRARAQREPALDLADGVGAPPERPRPVDAVWQAMLDLAPRQRAVLVLRLFEQLCDREIARALTTPERGVARSARHGLEQVGMTAGLVVEDEISGRRSHGALDMVAAQVAACFEEHHRDAPDVVVPLARIHAGTVGIRPHRSRTRPLVFAGAASALALVGVLAVRVWPDEPVPQGSPAASAAVSILPAAPPGTRLVGYADVAVAVPDDWGHNAVSCNGEPQDSVIYPDAAVTERCAVDPRVSTVAFTNPTSAAMYYSSIHPPVIDRIDGDKVLGTALNRTHGVYEQTVVVPSSGFLMVVRSPRQSVVRDVVGSVRVVPEGFTVVPACGGQRLGDAFAALLAAGLKPAVNRVSTASERLGQPPVKYQDVDSGQLVPVGSEVALFVPSS